MNTSIWDKSVAEKSSHLVYVQPVDLSNENKLFEILEAFTGRKESYHLSTFQRSLATSISTNIPEIQQMAHIIRDRICSGLRFCVVRGLAFQQYPSEIRDLYILAITSLIGRPTVTDRVTQKVLWPVKPSLHPEQKNLTFSQTLDEAGYHTDTQYFAEPEEMFGLWCVRPDKNGFGVNGLIDGQELVRRLGTTSCGAQAISTFENIDFPFRVPSVFTGDAKDSTVEVHEARVLGSKPYIRYRLETIQKGFAALARTMTKDQAFAIAQFETVINFNDIGYQLLLREGDALFVNNHQILHSRTAFTDPERFLIRVRMNNF